MFAQYFRQCIQHPPPNFPPPSPQFRPAYPAGYQSAARQRSLPPPSVPHSHQARFYSPRYSGGDVIAKSSDGSSPESASLAACRLRSVDAVQCRKVDSCSVLTRSLSEPLDDGKRKLGSAATQRTGDDRRETGGVDAASSSLINGQKIIDSAEKLTSFSDREDKSVDESVDSHTDLVYRSAWKAPLDGSHDSGCVSDQSSGSGGSPSATASPQQSPVSDSNVDEYALTNDVGELQLDRGDGEHKQTTGGSALTPAPSVVVSFHTRVGAPPPPSLPRYARPMRDIPPRFRHLLAAEAERVVRLCQRLNGSPLYSAATPSDVVPQPTDDNPPSAPSDAVGHENQAAYFDKPLAGQTPYSGQSPLIYVTAQSSGVPVYPPTSGVSVPINGAVEAASYVMPLGVGNPSLIGCGNGLPPTAEALPPSVPMFVANPFYYFPGASMQPPPPPDVAYMIPSPAVGGCPQPAVGAETAPAALARNAQQSDQVNAAPVDAAAADGVFQSAMTNGCSTYTNYYCNAADMPSYCSVQLMQA